MIQAIQGRASVWAQDGRLYAVLSAGGFSMKAIFVKLSYAAGQVDPLSLLALRMAFALPLFGWLTWKSGRADAPVLTRSDILRIWIIGALGYYLASLFDFYGLAYITAGLERMILFIYPTLVLLLQACWTRKAPGKQAWLAMAICYAGLAIAFAHDIGQAGQGSDVLIGSAWVFASAVTYALYYFGTGEMIKRVGSMRLAGLAGSASCVLVLLHYALFGNWQALPGLPPEVWINSGLMAFFSTVLPIYWLALAIQRLGAGQSATIGTLGPVLTVFAAWLLLDEPLSLFQLAGLALVIFGVTRLKPQRSPTPATADAAGTVQK